MESEHFRERLVSEQERVEGLVGGLRHELGDAGGSESAGGLSNYEQHPADQGTDTFEREKDLSILESLERELAEIGAALRRIDDGTYGIDEVTGEPIDPERLEADPAARTNIATAKQEERA